MKLFQITDRGPYSRGFPYASGYGPLPEMPFFPHGSPLAARTLEFWKINPMKSGAYIDQKGTKWCDFIPMYFAPPSLLISERVVDQMKALGCKFRAVTKMPLAEIDNARLRKIPSPCYFVVQMENGIEPDYAAMGLPGYTGSQPVDLAVPPEKWRARAETWNGDDLFSWPWDSLGLTLLCTERVVDLAEKEKWTNVRFAPVPTS